MNTRAANGQEPRPNLDRDARLHPSGKIHSACGTITQDLPQPARSWARSGGPTHRQGVAVPVKFQAVNSLTPTREGDVNPIRTQHERATIDEEKGPNRGNAGALWISPMSRGAGHRVWQGVLPRVVGVPTSEWVRSRREEREHEHRSEEGLRVRCDLLHPWREIAREINGLTGLAVSHEVLRTNYPDPEEISSS